MCPHLHIYSYVKNIPRSGFHSEPQAWPFCSSGTFKNSVPPCRDGLTRRKEGWCRRAKSMISALPLVASSPRPGMKACFFLLFLTKTMVFPWKNNCILHLLHHSRHGLYTSIGLIEPIAVSIPSLTAPSANISRIRCVGVGRQASSSNHVQSPRRRRFNVL